MKHFFREADKKIGIVELCTGQTSLGQNFFAYISILPSKYEQYKQAQSFGQVMDLTEYGEILEAGMGINPPEKIMREMEEKYNLDHSFEDNFKKEIAKLHEERI